MYYHSIDFKTQSAFFLFSFLAGVLSGFLFLLLTANFKKRKIAIISETLACVLSLLIFLCTNLVFEDAALRVYELIAYLCAFILTVLLLKPARDKLAKKLYNRFGKPFYERIKQLVNSLRRVLKKEWRIVYNFLNKKVGEFQTTWPPRMLKRKKRKTSSQNREKA